MEDKRLKFRRVCEKRMGRLLKEIQLIGNLGDRKSYEYEQADIEKIFSSIDTELKQARSRFSVRSNTAFRL